MGLFHAPAPRRLHRHHDRRRAFCLRRSRPGWLSKLLTEGMLIVASPRTGQLNTGIAIFEAPDKETARRIVADEPVTSGGNMDGDLRPYRPGLLRGRDR